MSAMSWFSVEEERMMDQMRRAERDMRMMYSTHTFSPNLVHAGWDGRLMAQRDANEGDKAMAMSEMQGIKDSAVAIVVKEEKKVESSVAMLKDLGFANLHRIASDIASRAVKENLIGVAGFKKIPAGKFGEARKRVQEKSQYALDLLITPVDKYLGQNVEIVPSGTVVDQEISLPPTEVLGKMADAKKEGLFDTFAVIHCARVNDPILVGRVNGSEDFYFIAEWGNDITLDELMK